MEFYMLSKDLSHSALDLMFGIPFVLWFILFRILQINSISPAEVGFVFFFAPKTWIDAWAASLREPHGHISTAEHLLLAGVFTKLK